MTTIKTKRAYTLILYASQDLPICGKVMVQVYLFSESPGARVCALSTTSDH